MKKTNLLLVALLGLATLNSNADTINAEKLAEKYATSAQLVDKNFVPSAVEGKQFFNRVFKNNGHEVACASCHTQNPANEGKNIITKKSIKPLSPVVNSKRFTDTHDVEDNFTKHCNDIVGADCSAQEKANFITYLLTEKTPSK